MANQLLNRTISRAHYDRLTDAMRKAADSWGWRVVDSPTPHDPAVITLQDLGLEPYIAPPLEAKPPIEQPRSIPVTRSPAPTRAAARQYHESPERMPTLEEYVNAGYPVHQYASFVERETEYRIQRKRQADELSAAKRE